MQMMQMMPDDIYLKLIRLADYDPIRARHYDETLTLTEIARAVMVKAHDNETKIESLKK